MTTPDQLIQTSINLQRTINSGIDWLNQHADPEKREATLDELGKCRREALRYEKAALLRPTIALYGQSQVGKSYLVSNLVRQPSDTILAIDTVGIPHENIARTINHPLPISFIDDINPPGGGAESTGIVTRFTTYYADNEAGYQLKIFSQADVVKILAKGYFSVIRDSHFPESVTDDMLANLIQQLRDRQQPTIQPGITADDVLDIRDYLQKEFRNNSLVEKLRSSHFWEQVAPILPNLSVEKRVAAFELLWAKQPFLTMLFGQLMVGLQNMAFASEVWVGLDVIAPQDCSIIDVVRLNEINNGSKPVSTLSMNGRTAEIDRGILSALTSELVLPIPKIVAQHPGRKFLQSADVLDFPGARGMDEIKEEVFEKNTQAEKMSLFLRGKIAYLFATYNDTFAISSLLLCMHDEQINAKSIPGTIAEWIRDKIGNSAQARETREQELAKMVPEDSRRGAHRMNPFFLVLTKINIEINKSDLNKGLEQHKPKWETRLKRNFNETMNQVTNDKWPDNWNTTDGSFRNTYLIRDPTPKFSEPSFIQTPEGLEERSPRFAGVFQDLQQSFLANDYVQRHFYQPERAWQEATDPGKSGIDYLILNLTPTSHPNVKLEQINGALTVLTQRIGQALCKHYEGGSIDEKLARARERGQKTLQPMGMMVISKKLGLFLSRLSLSEPLLTLDGSMPWDLAICRQIMNEPAPVPAPAAEAALPVKTQAELDMEKMLQELGLATPEPDISQASVSQVSSAPRVSIAAERFTELVLSRWITELGDICNDNNWLRLIGLSSDAATTITDELIRSMTRSHLKEGITEAIAPYINQYVNQEIVVSISRAMINNFINTVGWNTVEDEIKLKNNAVIKTEENQIQPIFSETVLPAVDKHSLRLNMEDPGRAYKMAWLQGIQRSFEYNVLAESGVSDPHRAALNGQLERLIKQLDYQCN